MRVVASSGALLHVVTFRWKCQSVVNTVQRQMPRRLATGFFYRESPNGGKAPCAWNQLGKNLTQKELNQDLIPTRWWWSTICHSTKWKQYVLTHSMSPTVFLAVYGNPPVASFPAEPDPERIKSRFNSKPMVGKHHMLETSWEQYRLTPSMSPIVTLYDLTSQDLIPTQYHMLENGWEQYRLTPSKFPIVTQL